MEQFSGRNSKNFDVVDYEAGKMFRGFKNNARRQQQGQS